MKKIILIILLVISTTFIFGDNYNENKNTQKQDININIQNYPDNSSNNNMNNNNINNNMDEYITNMDSSFVIGFGTTTPLIGAADNVYYKNVKYTKNLTGINPLIGFSKRVYFGNGLPENGGEFYWEIGTVVILVPYIGIGYDFRLEDTLIIGLGIPDLLHIAFTF